MAGLGGEEMGTQVTDGKGTKPGDSAVAAAGTST